jgi:Domain of unknown function (DUF4129)
MKMRIKFLLTGFLLFFHLLLPGWGLRAAPDPVEITEPLQVRYPDPARLSKLQADDAFRYRQQGRPALSFWDRFWWKVKQALGKLFYHQKSGKYGTYTLYALGIGIMVWVILKLLRVEFSSLFGRQSVAMPIAYETYREDIHEIDFPALIAGAEAQGDYRRAVRLYYLRVLKNLTDKALIEWSPSKTNWCYVYELKSGPLRRPFENLTRQFEFIWYGGTALQEPVFQQVRLSFETFDSLVKTRV